MEIAFNAVNIYLFRRVMNVKKKMKAAKDAPYKACILTVTMSCYFDNSERKDEKLNKAKLDESDTTRKRIALFVVLCQIGKRIGFIMVIIYGS